jgi:hypothetical protein
MSGYLTCVLDLCRKEKHAIKRKDETNVVQLYLPLEVPRLACWNQLAPLHFGAAGKLIFSFNLVLRHAPLSMLQHIPSVRWRRT